MDVLSQILGKIDKLLGLSARPVTVVWVVCGGLALLPESVFIFVHAETLQAQIQPWAGIVALACTFWLLVIVGWKAAEWMRTKVYRRHVMRTLTPVERNYLRNYVTGKRTSLHLPQDDGVALGLVHKQVLYLPYPIAAAMRNQVPFVLSPWAWDMLRENPNLLPEAPEVIS